MVTFLNTVELDNGANVRLNINAGLDALQASIQAIGIQVPLDVYRDLSSGQWVVHEGHRRLAVAIKLNMSTVPVAEREPFEFESQRILSQLEINEKRQSLSFLDRAHAYADLKAVGMSQHEIALATRKGDPEISLTLAVLKADPSVQQAVEDGRLNASSVEPLLSLSPEDQRRLLPAAVNARTVRGISKLVSADKLTKEPITVKQNESTLADADPQEMMAVYALQVALSDLLDVQSMKVVHPELQARGRQTVKDLMATAKRLEAEMF